MANLTVSDVMKTNLKTMSEDEAVSLADWEMSLDEIRHLLVVDGVGKLVGILSDRDVLRAARDLGGREVPIGRIMCRDVLTIEPTAPAATAVERMLRGKYSALPVVDDRGHPIGIVTSTDFLEVAYRALTGSETRAPARG
jgi:CBS domain-containing protein